MTTGPVATQHLRPRLSAATLAASLPDAVPRYDRQGPRAIVHLGVGAFMRAHLATYAEDLLELGWPARIHGISLRGDRAEQQLAPQDGLFSLTVREPDRLVVPRIVGSLVTVSTGARAAVEAIADPGTRLVTLTITEKGYHVVDGEPTAASVIADGLARRGRSFEPPVFASLDNVTSNGTVLRAAVLDAAIRIDRDLARWIGDEVRFADSVVDRLVPATSAEDLTEVEAALGLRDDGAVTCEEHRSWVISRVDGLPPLEDVGVIVTDEIAPFEQRKLWLLNGPHSALAYAGLLTGCSTIAEAATHPVAGAFARRIADAAVEVLDPAEAAVSRDVAATSLQRFANPTLGHTCVQVGADGSEKLRQRILPVAASRLQLGLDVGDHATLVACWLACASGIEVAGRNPQRTADPIGPALTTAARSGGVDAVVTAGLADDTPAVFSFRVAEALRRLCDDGAAVLATWR